MLLPVLENAHETAKQIVCQSNLKQIGTYYMQYSDDFDGYFIKHYNGTNTWYKSFNNYSELNILLSNIESSILICPSKEECSLSYHGTYGDNQEVLGWSTSPYLRSSQLESPSNTIMFGDFGAFNNNGYAIWRFNSSQSDKPPGDYHSGGANILFFDLHTEWYMQDVVWYNDSLWQLYK
jgi:prepilin-type processing-associated H-X9-DG protein